MGWKEQLAAGIGLLLSAGAGVTGSGEEIRSLSPIISIPLQPNSLLREGMRRQPSPSS